MFPLKANDPYIKATGERSTLGSVVGGGGSDTPELPEYSIADAGKVLKVADDGTLEWDTSGAGGGEYLLAYDYTKFGSRTIKGTVYSGTGALLNADGSEIIIPITFNNISLFIDVEKLQLTADTNRRFIMGEYNQGFIYRNTGVWGFYGSTSSWEMTELTDGDLFDGSTVKVYIDGDNKWHIYKDGVLIFEPINALPITTLTIGSYNGYSIQGGIITGARIYNGNYTE